MADGGQTAGFSNRGWRVAGWVGIATLVLVVGILLAIYLVPSGGPGIDTVRDDDGGLFGGDGAPPEGGVGNPAVGNVGTGGELAGPGAQGGGGGGTSNDQGRAHATTGDAAFGQEGNVRIDPE